MSVLKFKCTLLSDVILNQKAATEGNQSTLDFIPGNNFLGIVAGTVYAKHKELAMDILHSGKVRFGDAHPAQNGLRSLKIPASYFYPKMGSFKSECYVHHNITDFAGLKTKQLKQCRNAFVCFDEQSFADISISTTFAIKSAHDRENRRSKDSQMFGYESLNKGQEFYFEVEIEESLGTDVVSLIEDSLVGEKRVGRSRTAQYGLVKIEREDFKTQESQNSGSDVTVVYADGRLIFLDEFGMPTFTPTADQLGAAGGTILWEKSQVRTFQYAPWNFKRQARDMDRCGIEKGSVFVIQGGNVDVTKRFVGEYKNEGFGKIIYNPAFLQSAPSSNGLLNLKYAEKIAEKSTAKIELSGTTLLNFLGKCKKERTDASAVFRLVNEFVGKNYRNWAEGSFASQWGTIRGIALRLNSRKDILQELYGDENAYLKHGIAAEKWKEYGRIDILEKFLSSNEIQKLSEKAFKELVVNLASEMSKKIQGGV